MGNRLVMNKLLSIVIPVYNVEKYIACCLNSIFDQQFDEQSFEVVVVNDGTSDNSMQIVNSFVAMHQNIVVANQKNQGLSVARNTGLCLAKGEFIWFVDSDDWLFERSLEKVMNTLHEYPNIDIITYPLLWSYDDCKNNRIDIHVTENLKMSGKQFIKLIGATGAIQRNIIRKSLLEKNKIAFFPGILHEDGLFGPEIFYLARDVLVEKDPIYNYRQRSMSIMNSRTIKSAYDLIIVHQQLMLFKKRCVKDYDYLWFDLFCFELFFSSIAFVWHLRNSIKFRLFLDESKKYRQECCKNNLRYKNLKFCFMSVLVYFAPVFVVRMRLNIRQLKKCLFPPKLRNTTDRI